MTTYPLARIGPLVLPFSRETTHVQIAGTTGAGKSQIIARVLLALSHRRARGESVIVADPGCSFMPYFFLNKGTPAGYTDGLINPLDRRSLPWSPLAEIRAGTAYAEADVARVAASIIAHKSESYGDSAEWRKYARNVIESVLLRLAERGGNNHDLVRLCTRGEAWSEIKEICADSRASALWLPENDRFRASVLGIVGVHLAAFSSLPPAAGSKSFSIHKWITGGYPKSRGSWLWITSEHGQIEMMRPLIAALIGEAVSAAISLPPDRNRRTWLVNDELPELGDVNALASALTQGRKYGLACIFGYQSIAQLREIYGQNGAQILLSCARSAVIMAQGDPDTSEYFSRYLGEQEIIEAQVSESESAGDVGTRNSTTFIRKTRKLVLPNELQDMPDLSALAKLPGDNQIYRIRIPLITPKLPRISTNFVPKIISPIVRPQAQAVKEITQDDSQTTPPKKNQRSSLDIEDLV